MEGHTGPTLDLPKGLACRRGQLGVRCYVLRPPQAAQVLSLRWKHPINHWSQSSVTLVQAYVQSPPGCQEYLGPPCCLQARTKRGPRPPACSSRASQLGPEKAPVGCPCARAGSHVVTHSPLHTRVTLGPPVFGNAPTHPVRLSKPAGAGSGCAWGQRGTACL